MIKWLIAPKVSIKAYKDEHFHQRPQLPAKAAARRRGQISHSSRHSAEDKRFQQRTQLPSKATARRRGRSSHSSRISAEDERFQQRPQLTAKSAAMRRWQSSHYIRSSAEENIDWRSTARKLKAPERFQPTICTKGYKAYGRFLPTISAVTKNSSDRNSRSNIYQVLHESTDRDP